MIGVRNREQQVLEMSGKVVEQLAHLGSYSRDTLNNVLIFNFTGLIFFKFRVRHLKGIPPSILITLTVKLIKQLLAMNKDCVCVACSFLQNICSVTRPCLEKTCQ